MNEYLKGSIMRIALMTTILLITGFSVSNTFAKGWHGIIPLHSTREDVEHLLGKPTINSSESAYYDLGNEIIMVWFQTNSCSEGAGTYGLGWNVPIGTVTSLGVIHKRAVRLDNLINDKHLKIEKEGKDLIYYINRSEGLIIETQNQKITSQTFMPTENEQNMRCPQMQKRIVDFFPLDEYGNLAFEDEKTRLDNFAIALKNNPTVRGVLIVYGGQQGNKDEAKNRATRAKNFLMKSHGLESWRILAVEGGYREWLTVVLETQPIGSELFSHVIVTPTVNPRDIKIFEDKNKKRPQHIKPRSH